MTTRPTPQALADPERRTAILFQASPQNCTPTTIRRRIALTLGLGDEIAATYWSDALVEANLRTAGRVQCWRRKAA